MINRIMTIAIKLAKFLTEANHKDSLDQSITANYITSGENTKYYMLVSINRSETL